MFFVATNARPRSDQHVLGQVHVPDNGTLMEIFHGGAISSQCKAF